MSVCGGLALAGCGGASEGGGRGSTGLASPEVAKGWAAKFCQAQIGATRAEMRAVMGNPTEEYTADEVESGFEPQMSWDAYQFHYTAFFDADDHVRQLDINDIDLTDAEKAALPCDTTRTG
jgi:hypothetical protein